MGDRDATPTGGEADGGDVPFRRVAIVGMGLMGGSLGLALRERRPAIHVTGIVRRAEMVDRCVTLGASHAATTDMAAGVADADLVVLSTPVRTLIAQIPEVARHMRPGAVLT